MAVEKTDAIVAYGVLRSGSTFIWQILYHLFDDHKMDKIIKTHSLMETTNKVVATFRDFRDVAASSYRVEKKLSPTDSMIKMSVEDVEFYVTRAKGWVRVLDSYRRKYSDEQMILLRYEEFFNNFKFIFDQFENFFGIAIPEAKRKAIRTECNLAKNRKRQGEVPDGRKNVWPARIQRCHIFTGKPDSWKMTVPEELQPRVNEILHDELVQWGYEE